jgi:hypothetical protein
MKKLQSVETKARPLKKWRDVTALAAMRKLLEPVANRSRSLHDVLKSRAARDWETIRLAAFRRFGYRAPRFQEGTHGILEPRGHRHFFVDGCNRPARRRSLGDAER